MASNRSKRDEKAKENLLLRRRNRHTGISEFDWSSADSGALANAIVAVTRANCAIQFGRTRDGGSGVVRIVGDGDAPYNEFIRATEDVNFYLQGLADDFENVVRD